MEIKDYLLEGVSVEASPNCGGSYFFPPDMIVLHYTASDSFKGTVNWLCNETAKASAHLVVGREGEIAQLVPFNKKAWHAGYSSWKMDSGEERSDLNRYSIGIEIANAGPLTQKGDAYKDYTGRYTYSKSDVIEATHRNGKPSGFWRTYSEKQISAVREICRALMRAYPIKCIVGHEEIAPSRKIDPGPAFPLDDFRTALFQELKTASTASSAAATPSAATSSPAPAASAAPEETTIAEVTASKLNIRKTPGGALAADPLDNGQLVKILEEEGNWVKVETTLTGWVYNKYLKTRKG